MNIIKNCIYTGSVSLWNTFTFLFNRLTECCRSHKSKARANEAQLNKLMEDVSKSFIHNNPQDSLLRNRFATESKKPTEPMATTTTTTTLVAAEDSTQKPNFTEEELKKFEYALSRHALQELPAYHHTLRYEGKCEEILELGLLKEDALKELGSECDEIMSNDQMTQEEKMGLICQRTKATMQAASVNHEVSRYFVENWLDDLDENIRPLFEKILKHRMWAFECLEVKKRKILNELSKETLFFEIHKTTNSDQIRISLYDGTCMDVLDSHEDLKIYKMAMLKRCVQWAMGKIPCFNHDPRSPYGPGLQCVNDVVARINELYLSELEKAELIVHLYESNSTLKAHSCNKLKTLEALRSEFPNYYNAKDYIELQL